MNIAGNAHAATGAGANKIDAGVGNTYRNFVLRVVSSVPDSAVNLETSPDGTTWTTMATVTGDGWGYARSDHKTRQARANVTSLGTGTPGLSTNVSGY